MAKEKNYTTANTLGELFDHLDYYVKVYDHESRRKKFSDMQIKAEKLAELHENLHFSKDRNGEFIITFEFLNETIGIFTGKLDSNQEDMTFTLIGKETLGSAKTVKTVLHIEKNNRGVLELVPDKDKNPFLVERALLSSDAMGYLFFKFLNYMVYIVVP